MIGSNDFCLDVCYYENQDKLIEDAERNMIHVLRILRENLPRTLVNVVIPVGTYRNVLDVTNEIYACAFQMLEFSFRSKILRQSVRDFTI